VPKKAPNDFLAHGIRLSHSSAMSQQTVPTFQEEIEPGRFLTMPEDGSGVVVIDPWLEPFKPALQTRYVVLHRSSIHTKIPN
jgi:hypothetical protein